MADIRINALAGTATSAASDDYLALDGAANGTRKILASNIAQNVSDVVLGTNGPSVKSSLDARAARQGLVFNGTAGATVNVPAFGTSDFTVVVVAAPTSNASDYSFISGASGAAQFKYRQPSNQIQFGTAAVSTQLAVTSPIVLNKYNFLVYTRSGTTGTLYVDGVSVGTATDSANYSTAVTTIGSAAGGTELLNGFLSVLIYNRALSASEVVSLFEAGVPSGADYPALKAGTALITGANSDFSSDTGFWTKGSGSVTITGGEAVWTGATYLAATSITPLEKGMQYLLTLNVTQASTNGWSYFNGSGYVSTGITGTGVKTAVLTFVARQTGGFYITNGDGTNGKITDISLTPLGLLLAPDAGQAGGGLTWYDTSGNSASITLPASGVSWNVPFAGYIPAVKSPFLINGKSNGSSDLAVAHTTGNYGFNLVTTAGGNTTLGLATSSGATNISLSGSSGTASYITGNLLLGTTTDSSNGKLQLATHTTSAGGIGFGSDLALFRMAQGLFQQDSTGTQVGYRFSKSGTMKGQLVWSGSDTYLDYDGSLFLRAGYGGTTALTLDSSQRTILSGALRLNNAYTASVIVPTGYVTIQDSTGTTYKVAVSL